jgi:uncharacterized protein YwqG
MTQKVYTMRQQVKGVLIASLVTLILGIVCIIIAVAIPAGNAKSIMLLLAVVLSLTALISFIAGCKKYFENRESIKKESDLPKLNAEADVQKIKLKELLLPLIRKSTTLVVKSSENAEDSNLKSQFGGKPYFEKGEQWPTNKEGEALEFVFQIFNDGTLQMPENIKLIQFFFDFEECPWENGEDGYRVKLYEKLDKAGSVILANPCGQKEVKYCEIAFKEAKSLPDREEIGEISKEAENIVILTDNLFSGMEYRLERDIYGEAVEELTNGENCFSHLGGFAAWIQGADPNIVTNANDYILLCQINSEDDANVMWGDCGDIYIFYNTKTKELSYRLQCY